MREPDWLVKVKCPQPSDLLWKWRGIKRVRWGERRRMIAHRSVFLNSASFVASGHMHLTSSFERPGSKSAKHATIDVSTNISHLYYNKTLLSQSDHRTVIHEPQGRCPWTSLWSPQGLTCIEHSRCSSTFSPLGSIKYFKIIRSENLDIPVQATKLIFEKTFVLA